ncbi:MAG: pyruvate, phosphate dikinase [Actinobacteria bacterium]|nr:MAG: pyruvate, phosphate dikinase [Actinomycetota bacterium]
MKYVYAFSEGSKEQKFLLGGKGANLAEMTKIGLAVPSGFTITTEACNAYSNSGNKLPDGLLKEATSELRALEKSMGKKLGDSSDPLLVSVRSGAPFSMPGMMDTVLNLGLNDVSVAGLAKQTGNERFALDSYRRFIQMFAKIVLDVDGDLFEHAIEQLRTAKSVATDPELDSDALKELVATFKTIVAANAGMEFPQDPEEQLRLAIEAVFQSWNGERAKIYRRMEKIPDDLGTAVNVQSMVFGNKGEDSGTGVVFTRDPATGENVPYGDFLANAQGEDVVAGIRTTEPLAAMAGVFPECHEQLLGVLETLEQHYRDMCDIEFTIEQGKLFILQTRVGKRSALAALRIAREMEAEGMIDRREAVLRIDPAQLDQLLHPQFAPDSNYSVLTVGLNASPGAATGQVYFTADEAESRHEAGETVILVRPETSPDDLHGMIAAEGILTSRGGLVSHAAVVARGMGTPAVCGASALQIDLEEKTFRVGETAIKEGEVISISGTTGEVVVGSVAVTTPEPGEHFETILGWADEFRTLGVRANADLGHDAEVAIRFGAEGIGLCRTEHMFLGTRLHLIQRFILAESEADEVETLKELGDLQRKDFVEIFAAMDGLPVTVRLLDPPLHEFLPDIEELAVRDARGELDAADHKLYRAARSHHEENPMLGTRGVRLGVLKPNLYRTQVRAIFEAMFERTLAGGNPRVEIMIPLSVSKAELGFAVDQVREVAEEFAAETQGVGDLHYLVGTMIETPRAALVAGELAHQAEFFSFGTNDLTQMTFGFSRDDVEGSFMARYLELKLLDANPFETLDVGGVGQLVRLAVEKGRETRPNIKLGICGEHGGDPASVDFCHSVGLDYVSCSPFRVPLARLAAAHAALGANGPATTA